jgi:Uma2 family endonuclease
MRSSSEADLQLAETDRPPAQLSLKEYLHSSWSPDCDFVDSRIEERNVGSLKHSLILRSLLWILSGKERWQTWGFLPLPSLRIRVSASRVRIPDICVLKQGDGQCEAALGSRPTAIFEVLEPEDRFGATMEKLFDFDRFGAENIWIIDPEPRIAYRYADNSLQEVKEAELAVVGTPIRVVLSEMFAELDRV